MRCQDRWGETLDRGGGRVMVTQGGGELVWEM